jgi:hypothetical protein
MVNNPGNQQPDIEMEDDMGQFSEASDVLFLYLVAGYLGCSP